jgi:hypothetical protein
MCLLVILQLALAEGKVHFTTASGHLYEEIPVKPKFLNNITVTGS